MLLFTIVLLHTSLLLALVFMVIWLVFLLKGLCEKLVLCVLVSCLYTCFVYAQILFCRTFQVQKQQNKQTKDLSSSNRGRLLNKMIWCLQIQEESLKTLLLGVCVCCLVVWNLLIHSLRWSKFIWILCWTKWCSSFEESKPFEGCWSLGCACCCCAGLV